MTKYRPEGQAAQVSYTAADLRAAAHMGTIVEGRAVMCDAEHNLVVDLGAVTGLIPREEAAMGIRAGQTRDVAILSRVGKPVCCKVMHMESGKQTLLSRRLAQEEALYAMMDTLRPGDVCPARTTHLEPFGAFVDIGCGVVSLIGIEQISVSRIAHPSERFAVGQDVYVVISALEKGKNRIHLTHKELLGTWNDNAAHMEPGQTVAGIVRGLESYGAFVELTPNLSGLAERRLALSVGQRVSVYIKSITPERMKIKLAIVDAWDEPLTPLRQSDYFITSGHVDRWRYSPEDCTEKTVETIFK